MNNNSFIPILNNLFIELNKGQIKYCLLRDYDSSDKINNASDLDISIALCDKKQAINILETSGWKNIKLAVNDFAHSQYYKWDGTKFYKLDIIWDVYFADGGYRLGTHIIPYNEDCFIDNARLPKPDVAIILLLSHIAFDKESISKKNRAFLEFLYTNGHEDTELNGVLLSVLNSESDNHTIIKAIQKLLVEKKYVIRNNCLLWRTKKVFRKIRYRLNNKKQYKFALIGVDGTGKSTALHSINAVLGDKVHTEYFGFRLWKTEMAKRFLEKPYVKGSIVNFLKRCYVIFVEMKYRYMTAIQSNKRLLVFDRYVWEAYDNTDNKIAKIVYYILFVWLFAKPDGIIYLHCPINVSLERKDDIEDIDAFKKMKERFDSKYPNREDTLSINTSEVDEQNEIEMIATFMLERAGGAVVV